FRPGGGLLQGFDVQDESDQEAEAADIADERVLPLEDFVADAVTEIAGALAELLVANFRLHGERDSAGERGAAEGRAVAAGAKEIAEQRMGRICGNRTLADPDGADGKAAAEALCPAHAIGHEIRCDGFPSAPVTAAAKTGLHFIEQDQQVVLLPQ